MKRLIYLIPFCILFFSCSNHLADLFAASQTTVEEPKDTDINIDVDVDFKPFLIGCEDDENDPSKKIAKAAGITGETVTYKWYLDNTLLDSTGDTCEIATSSLTVGKHTVLVIATVDGMEYSADYTIIKE